MHLINSIPNVVNLLGFMLYFFFERNTGQDSNAIITWNDIFNKIELSFDCYI